MARAAEKLGRQKERLARLEAGGEPSRPMTVESASLVEPVALSFTCLQCGGPNRLEEHAAATVDGKRLRLAKLVCARCGARRDVWFQLDHALPH